MSTARKHKKILDGGKPAVKKTMMVVVQLKVEADTKELCEEAFSACMNEIESACEEREDEDGNYAVAEAKVLNGNDLAGLVKRMCS